MLPSQSTFIYRRTVATIWPRPGLVLEEEGCKQQSLTPLAQVSRSLRWSWLILWGEKYSLMSGPPGFATLI
jgi:hypothetical protein